MEAKNMDKSCIRCESEANVMNLPIGQKCLDILRAELSAYEEILTADEKTRLERRRAELEGTVAPYLTELSEVELRLLEIEKAGEKVALEAGKTELEAEVALLELEVEKVELGKLQALVETETLKADNDTLARELAETEELAKLADLAK